jgi:hypothetical protein
MRGLPTESALLALVFVAHEGLMLDLGVDFSRSGDEHWTELRAGLHAPDWRGRDRARAQLGQVPPAPSLTFRGRAYAAPRRSSTNYKHARSHTACAPLITCNRPISTRVPRGMSVACLNDTNGTPQRYERARHVREADQ